MKNPGSGLRLVRRFALALLGVVALLVLLLVADVVNITLGMHASARVQGSIAETGVYEPVRIIRDGRDVPHIRAANLHDLFYAQGYAEGSDRFFQMDFTRHFVYGKLTELLGAAALSTDETSRTIDAQAIVAKQWQGLSNDERSLLLAFSDGVNAAVTREPVPVEYRVLLTRPQPWTPQDSLAVGFAAIIGQAEDWHDVVNRNLLYRLYGAKFFPSIDAFTDPKYDAPTTDGRPAPLQPLQALPRTALFLNLPPKRVARLEWREGERPGSNAWVAGRALTATGRALLAADPHLELGIPGIWYLADLQAPGYHVAGASLAGTPGIILGHNDHLAWGITNGTTIAYSTYISPPATALVARHETFTVRFGKPVTKTYYGTPDGGFQVFDARGNAYIVRWQSAMHPQSPVVVFLGLDRVSSIQEALRVIATYQGPSSNYVLADTTGAVAYHLAGTIPNDPAWGRYAHRRSLIYPSLPFTALPAVAPSRSALAFTSNNRMYGSQYHYRLSADFAAPYRAYRVSALLRRHARYSVSDFAGMQMDTFSIPEAEVAQDVISAARRRPALVTPAIRPLITELQRWNGRIDGSERGATIARAVQREAVVDLYNAHFAQNVAVPDTVVLMRALRERPAGWVANNDYDRWLLGELELAASKAGGAEKLDIPWSIAGAVTVEHPLGSVGLSFLNGTLLAGDGDPWTVHVQRPGFGQSFRAVWDVGNWDGGGITIPQGESGEPGSGAYTNYAADWGAGRLVPLPFSQRAVDASAHATLTLMH